MSINIIACINTIRAIGHNNKKLYKIKEYLTLFNKLTENNIIIMGVKTAENIGRSLPNGHNIVVNRGNLFPMIKTSLQLKNKQELFIIGGGKIYEEVLSLRGYQYEINLYLTHVIDMKVGDTYFPNINLNDTKLWTERYRSTIRKDDESGLYYYMTHHHHAEATVSPLYHMMQEVYPTDKHHEEYQYLNLLRQCIMNGSKRETRNSITRSIFGVRMEFTHLPILTTKKFAWKTCIKELLWFISGDTNVKTLQSQNVHIWDANYNKDIDLFNTGDLGKIYGYQWRKCGGYIDQLQDCINMINRDPYSRRIIMSSWIPQDIPFMALPPCHLLCQWYVEDNTLSLQVYQRSGDALLGIPFNMFSYWVLLQLVALSTNKEIGKLILIIGDFHIYETHLQSIIAQLTRDPLKNDVELLIRTQPTIYQYTIDDFTINNYNYHPPITAPVVP